MSETERKSLSGYWTGVYAYDCAEEPVAFNAVLTEQDGAVVGEIIEPNTFVASPELEIFSSLSGVVDQDKVSFIKSYEALPGAGHRVRYDGVVLAQGEKIEGKWNIEPGWGGAFVMNRVSEGGAQLEVSFHAEYDSTA